MIRREIVMRGFKTEKRARGETETNSTHMDEDCRITDLCGDWQEEIKYRVKPSTYACYSTIIQKHILPAIGGIQLKEFTNGRLISFIKSEQDRGLAGSTLRLILFLIKSIIRHGEEKGRYPAEALRYYVPRARNTAMKLMSQDNFRMLTQRLLAPRNNFELGLLISFCTGIRVGELCGLQWGDVDFENGYLRVRRTVSRIRNTNLAGIPEAGKDMRTLLYIGEPKTSTSLRDIPLPDFMLPRLREKQRGNSLYLLTGSEKCMEPRGVQRRFKNLLRKCGIPDINIHSLRHTFASHWIENGFDSKALSEILGHSSVKITMDIYVHCNMNQKKNYMNQMMVL